MDVNIIDERLLIEDAEILLWYKMKKYARRFHFPTIYIDRQGTYQFIAPEIFYENLFKEHDETTNHLLH